MLTKRWNPPRLTGWTVMGIAGYSCAHVNMLLGRTQFACPVMVSLFMYKLQRQIFVKNVNVYRE